MCSSCSPLTAHDVDTIIFFFLQKSNSYRSCSLPKVIIMAGIGAKTWPWAIRACLIATVLYVLFTLAIGIVGNPKINKHLKTEPRKYVQWFRLSCMNAKWMNLLFCFEDIKGPKKLFPDLPFGNMDSDRVEARKSLLESFLKVSICSSGFAHILTPNIQPKVVRSGAWDFFWHICLLQQLCAIPEIANSEEVQEFLALNTDARIAFVKKPFMVSRIDKVTAEPLCSALVPLQVWSVH